MQFSTGVACSKSLNNRSTNRKEYCVAFPAKLEGTDDFAHTYLACTKIGALCDISFCIPSRLSPEQITRKKRFASSTEYFGCMSKFLGKIKASPDHNGFEQYSFARLPPGGMLKAHIDDENSTLYPDLLSIGQFDDEGNRHNALCYMRQSADEAMDRVEICRRIDARFVKHAKNTEYYQRTCVPKDYFDHLGDHGILVIYDKETLRTKFVASIQRPPLDKTAYYTSAPASSILNLHDAVDLNLVQAVELCIIFGLCNSVDIFCCVLSQWTMNGRLPETPDDTFLADSFFREVSNRYVISVLSTQ